MARSMLDRRSREVAVVAARLMQEQGLDYLAAKKKAALSLGLGDRVKLPTNRLIQQALLEHQRLFLGGDTKEELARLREAAVDAMRILTSFQPRLVGAVLSGAITSGSAVELHVFSDSPESVAITLMEKDIDYRLVERRVRARAETYVLTPVYCIEHMDVEVDVYVFAVDGQRQSPLSPVDGKPMARAPEGDVRILLEQQPSISVIDDFFSQ